MATTPKALPAAKAASTTNTMGARHSTPKNHFTEATCWLLSAKANKVKNTKALRVQLISRIPSAFYGARWAETWVFMAGQAAGAGALAVGAASTSASTKAASIR